MTNACPDCGGSGWYTEEGGTRDEVVHTTCEACEGNGWQWSD